MLCLCYVCVTVGYISCVLRMESVFVVVVVVVVVSAYIWIMLLTIKHLMCCVYQCFSGIRQTI